MKYLGKIYNEDSKITIVKANFTPKIGGTVVDKDGKEVGIVNGILGPVKTPYISIKTFKKINYKELYMR